MVSFRELYGFLTGEKLAEIAGAAEGGRRPRRQPRERRGGAVRQQGGRGAGRQGAAPDRAPTTTPGVAPVMRDLGESLGGKLQREEAAQPGVPAERGRGGRGAERRGHPQGPQEARPRPSRRSRRRARRTACRSRRSTGRRRPGLIGQFIDVARSVLYVAILIIFMVALVIINNALVMATLERVREIGTLRAIGAQRRFILAMLVIEALVVGVVFGGAGRRGWARCWSASSARSASPPSPTSWFFFFSGPRLHPFLGTSNVDRRVRHRAAGQRVLQLLPGLAGDAGHPAPGDAGGGITMSKLVVDLHDRVPQPGAAPAPHAVPGRRHRRRDRAAGAAERRCRPGVRETMIDTATTLSTATSTWAASSR